MERYSNTYKHLKRIRGTQQEKNPVTINNYLRGLTHSAPFPTAFFLSFIYIIDSTYKPFKKEYVHKRIKKKKKIKNTLFTFFYQLNQYNDSNFLLNNSSVIRCHKSHTFTGSSYAVKGRNGRSTKEVPVLLTGSSLKHTANIFSLGLSTVNHNHVTNKKIFVALSSRRPLRLCGPRDWVAFSHHTAARK
ncbi:hypothetical protein BD770DRAFT_152835 [Pilaira anomala]|nr:hypothetical protein BD770DRAFT_152835 [Pilaira anomala]